MALDPSIILMDASWKGAKRLSEKNAAKDWERPQYEEQRFLQEIAGTAVEAAVAAPIQLHKSFPSLSPVNGDVVRAFG